LNGDNSGLAFARQKFSTHQIVLNFIRPLGDSWQMLSPTIVDISDLVDPEIHSPEVLFALTPPIHDELVLRNL
jgi:hypothetical protein